MNPQAPADNSGTVTDGSVIENALLGGNRNAPLTATAERIYDKLVAEEPKEGEKSEPREPAKEAQKTETAAPAQSEAAVETAEATEEPGGYFADEGIDNSEPTPAPTAQPVQENVLPNNFTAEEQYIAQNIGQPITVRIKVGDSIQTVQAYSPANLPEGYVYASQADHDRAILGFDALTRKAEQLQVQYRNEQMQKTANEFAAQEDADIQRDIAFLQREKAAGRDGLDLFKTLDVNDPEFEKDPAVKEMQDILEFYNSENQARWEQSQRNRTQYRPLTYRDAFRLYRMDNPKVGPNQAKEDAERKEIAKPLAKANKGSGDAPKQGRPKLGRYANIDQIIQAYNL